MVCPDFDSSEVHFEPGSSNGAGFSAMTRQKPRYMGCCCFFAPNGATVAGMYLRESKQKRADGREIVYLQLAENVWDPAKGRSQARIVHNRGRADDPQVIERLHRLVKSILRRCSPDEIVADGGDWRLVCAWPYGDVYALEAVWRRLGIDAIVRAQACERRFSFDIERALVANRACAPASRLYCHERWLKEDVRIDCTQAQALHQLYRAVDFLKANKAAIEQAIFYQVADLLSLDVDIIFYDTTSLHFEIDDEDEGNEKGQVRGSMPAGAKTCAAPRKRGHESRTVVAMRRKLSSASRSIAELERFDGKFVVHTNDDTLSAENMALGYKQQQRVEEAWRTMKSGLKMRPVFHWAPHRIHAHIAITVFALLLERVIERDCRDTWRNIRDDLKRIQLAQLSSPNGTVWQVTEPAADAANRLKALKIKPPPAVHKLD